MVSIRSKEQGAAHLLLVILAVVVVLAGVGYLYWQNFIQADTDNTGNVKQVPTQTKQSEKEFCDDDEDVMAASGTFCSEELGIKLDVPDIFAGKLKKIKNYEVSEGPLEWDAKKSAGLSDNVYQAKMTGNDNFTFTIAQEPIRTGYIDFTYKLQNTYYDQSTGKLTLVKSPTRTYNSATDKTTLTGKYSKGEVVPSFKAGGVRFFEGGVGDAGLTGINFLGIVNEKFIVITIRNQGYMGDPANNPTTIDAQGVFEELDSSVKQIEVM